MLIHKYSLTDEWPRSECRMRGRVCFTPGLYLSPPPHCTIRPQSPVRVLFLFCLNISFGHQGVSDNRSQYSQVSTTRSITVHHRSNHRVVRRNRFHGFWFERNLFVVLKIPTVATAAFNPKNMSQLGRFP